MHSVLTLQNNDRYNAAVSATLITLTHCKVSKGVGRSAKASRIFSFRSALAYFFSFLISLLLISTPAIANCTPPNTISNGQVADASLVMGDITAVAACVDAKNPAGPVHSIQFNADGSTFGSVGPLSDGQVIVGSTGNVPVAANLTAGPGIAISNGSGSITISASGSGGALPAIRGSGMQTSSASSYVVSWPSGSVAGDLAIVFVGGGWQISGVPSGWTLIDQQTGSNWNGAVFGKLLTSADISAGSVTVNMAGTFDSAVSIITFQGNTTGVSSFNSSQDAAGATVRLLSAPPSTNGAMYIYFGSGRTSATVSVNAGSILQSQNDGSAASGALYASSARPFFGSVNFNYAAVPTGDYQSIIAVTGP